MLSERSNDNTKLNCKVFNYIKIPFIWNPCLWTFPHEDCIPKVNSALQDLTGLTMPHFWGLFVWPEAHPAETTTAFCYFEPVVEDSEGNDWLNKIFKDFTSRLQLLTCWGGWWGEVSPSHPPRGCVCLGCLQQLLQKKAFCIKHPQLLIQLMGFQTVWLLHFQGNLFSRGCLFTAVQCTWSLSLVSWSSNCACALFTDICAKTLFPKGFPAWNSTKLPGNGVEYRFHII